MSGGVRRFLIGSSGISFLTRHKLIGTLCNKRRPNKHLIRRRSCQHVAPTILHRFCSHCCRSGGYDVCLSNGMANSYVREVRSLFNYRTFNASFHGPRGARFRPIAASKGHVFVRHPSTLRDTIHVNVLSLSHGRPSCLGTHMLIALFKNCFNDHLVSGVQRSGKCACNVSTTVVPCPKRKILTIDTRTTGRFIRPLVNRICRRVSHLRGRLTSSKRLSVIGGCVLKSVYHDCRSTFSLTST